jgi:hypothetical protein
MCRCGFARSAQPPNDGCNSQRQGLTVADLNYINVKSVAGTCGNFYTALFLPGNQKNSAPEDRYDTEDWR